MTEIGFVYLTILCANIMFLVVIFKIFLGMATLNEKNADQQRQIDELKRELAELKRDR